MRHSFRRQALLAVVVTITALLTAGCSNMNVGFSPVVACSFDSDPADCK